MRYEVKINDETGKDEIFFDADKKRISNIDLLMEINNPDVTRRTNAVSAKLIIKGTLDYEDEIQLGNSIKLFNWAIDENSDNWYRSVELKVMTDKKIVKRSYIFKNIFVKDYHEFYIYEKENNAEPHFELILVQKEDCLNLIDTY